MAFTTIYLKNPESAKIKKAPIGFSWTVLFFGFWIPLFRGDLKNALILFFVTVSLLFLNFAFYYVLLTSTPSSIYLTIIVLMSMILVIIHLFYAFKYNKMFVKGLISKGFVVYESFNFSTKNLEGELEMSLPTVAEKSAKK